MRIRVLNGEVRMPGTIEHVERKGLGHPDTMCDAIAEHTSMLYAQYCLSTFGGIAHHWFDKVVLCGGESQISWGSANLVQPYRVHFFGKVTRKVGDAVIPIEQILRRAATEVLHRALIGFRADEHLLVEDHLVDHQGAGRLNSRYQPEGPEHLVRLTELEDAKSNDCNLVSAYAPLSLLERCVLDSETRLNSVECRARFPFLGSDIKVFGMRDGENLSLVLNVPFLAGRTASKEQYLEHKQAILSYVRSVLPDAAATAGIEINPQDRSGHPYLTALGSAADTGDVGVVGRGNRINGLITPMRPMSIEAPAGKNPIDHTGKVYAMFAHELAHDAHRLIDAPVEVHVFTAKESPLTSPDEIVVAVGKCSVETAEQIDSLVRSRIAAIDLIIRRFVEEGVELW